MGGDEAALAREWVGAARAPAVSGALEGVYARVGEEIGRRGPACWASGRCCNFERAGHRLYVTGLEAAWTVVHQGRARADEESAAGGLALAQCAGSAPALSAATLGEALDRGGCPFQVVNLCGAHAVRPLGCRVYFCDRSAQEWQRGLSERALGEIRAIHEEHGVTYRYMEWRAALGAVLGAVGR